MKPNQQINKTKQTLAPPAPAKKMKPNKNKPSETNQAKQIMGKNKKVKRKKHEHMEKKKGTAPPAPAKKNKPNQQINK